MAECYAERATFSDIAFDLREKKRIHAMWHMICDGDIRTTFRIEDVDDRAGVVDVTDDYTFHSSGRRVHNVIQSRFRFERGTIVWHQDTCDPRRWGAMAVGGIGGYVAGRLSFVRRLKARRMLEAFVKAHPQYR
jgi:hypothetical protein